MGKIRIDAQFDPLEQREWEPNDLLPPPTFGQADYAQVQAKYAKAKEALAAFISSLEELSTDRWELGSREVLDIVRPALETLQGVAGLVEQIEEV